MDNDGDDDVIIGGGNSDPVDLLRNQAGITTAEDISAFLPSDGLDVGDVDGDHDLDIVTSTANETHQPADVPAQRRQGLQPQQRRRLERARLDRDPARSRAPLTGQAGKRARASSRTAAETTERGAERSAPTRSVVSGSPRATMRGDRVVDRRARRASGARRRSGGRASRSASPVASSIAIGFARVLAGERRRASRGSARTSRGRRRRCSRPPCPCRPAAPSARSVRMSPNMLVVTHDVVALGLGQHEHRERVDDRDVLLDVGEVRRRPRGTRRGTAGSRSARCA